MSHMINGFSVNNPITGFVSMSINNMCRKNSVTILMESNRDYLRNWKGIRMKMLDLVLAKVKK